MKMQGKKTLYRQRGKRIFDLALAVPAIILLSPVMLATACAIRIWLGSPICFRQARPGQFGRTFSLLKFRTMADVCDAQGKPLPDDRRTTRIGQFLRRTSLDELPELFNVFKGDMSLVGPRPLLMEYLTRYSTDQMRRHDVPPGITGWAQINGRNDTTWPQRFAHDLWYVDHCSFLLDVKILSITLWKTLKQEAISPPGKATMPFFMGPDEP